MSFGRVLLKFEIMKFAKYVFYVAGIYGIVALVPQYFLESKNSADFPPAITHAEYYYGFIGVALAFQIVFLLIGSDPQKYRAMMLPSIVEKFSFGIALVVLYLQNRLAPLMLGLGFIDMTLGVLFIASYFLVANKK